MKSIENIKYDLVGLIVANESELKVAIKEAFGDYEYDGSSNLVIQFSRDYNTECYIDVDCSPTIELELNFEYDEIQIIAVY